MTCLSLFCLLPSSLFHLYFPISSSPLLFSFHFLTLFYVFSLFFHSTNKVLRNILSRQECQLVRINIAGNSMGDSGIQVLRSGLAVSICYILVVVIYSLLIPYIFLSDRLSVCLCVCLSVCLSHYPSVCLLVYLTVYLFVSIYLSVCLSVCLIVSLPICLSTCLFVCLFICVYLSICRSVCLSLSVYLPVYLCLSVCLPICLLVHLSISPMSARLSIT